MDPNAHLAGDDAAEVTPVETEQSQPIQVDEHTEGEGGEGQPAEQPKFRAWEASRKVPTHIPYDRFREVNTEKNELRGELERLQNELAQYKKAGEAVAKVPEPEDIKPEDYSSPQEYMAARDKALLAKAHTTWRENLDAERQQEALNQHIGNVGNVYIKNISEAIQRDPDVANAKQFFDDYASQLHPQVAYELMIDENVGELMVDICTDENLLREIFGGDPAAAIRKLHKMSARIDRDARYGGQPQRHDTTPQIPRALTREQIAAGIPNRVTTQRTAAPNNVYKDAGRMSLSAYMKATGRA